MMRALLFFIAFASATPLVAQSTGSCNYKESCAWRCCRGQPGNPKCWCSLCCAARDLGPDDRAQSLRAGKRIADVYRHRVEFRVVGEEKPRAVRRYEEGIYPIDESTAKDGIILICTSAHWAVVSSTSAEKAFCGGVDFDGRERFRLKESESRELAREPLGTADGGSQALFALTKARKSGEREVVGYRLWTKGRPSELLPADSPRVRKLLERYEGPLVLPGPLQGN